MVTVAMIEKVMFVCLTSILFHSVKGFALKLSQPSVFPSWENEAGSY